MAPKQHTKHRELYDLEVQGCSFRHGAIFKIKAEEYLDYLLCILGKEGYATMDCWVPPDEAHK